jgi:hypothetical protein
VGVFVDRFGAQLINRYGAGISAFAHRCRSPKTQ